MIFQVVPLPFESNPLIDIPFGALVLSQSEKQSPCLLRNLPFKMYAYHLGSCANSSQVHEALMKLSEMASEDVEKSKSFNILFTEEWMAYIPRRMGTIGPLSIK